MKLEVEISLTKKVEKCMGDLLGEDFGFQYNFQMDFFAIGVSNIEKTCKRYCTQMLNHDDVRRRTHFSLRIAVLHLTLKFIIFMSSSSKNRTFSKDERCSKSSSTAFTPSSCRISSSETEFAIITLLRTNLNCRSAAVHCFYNNSGAWSKSLKVL